MSHTYSGNGTAVSPTVAGHTPVAISSSTNATPIAVTFQAAHGFSSGDTVEVLGHSTNDHANGIWQVLVTSPTVVTLVGSVGDGVGAATGYAIDYSLSPALTIPDDGDDDDAASIDPALEALANLAPFLYRAAGKYRLVDFYSVDFGTGGSGSYCAISLAGSTAMTAQTKTGASAPGLFGFAPGTNPPPPVIAPGDRLEIDFDTEVEFVTASAELHLNIGVQVNGGAYSVLAASDLVFLPFATSAPIPASMHFITSPFATGVRTYFDLAIMAAAPAVGLTAQLVGAGHLTVKHWRLN